MSAYACNGCGQTWPENYCPTCGATIDRSLLAAPVARASSLSEPSAGLGRGGLGAAAPPPSGPAWPAQPGRSGTGASSDAVPIEFTGSAGEYFRIWIVSVALTVLTLGIYAAWAKVNKRRYFWGNTQLAGRGFEYTGNPIAILKGNLIFGVVAIAYYVTSKVEPRFGLASFVVLWLIFPWLFHKAMRFNAHNTRHRNIRFGFHGGVGESYRINLGLLLLLPFTLGLLWPYMQYRRKRYQLDHLSFGTAPFQFAGEVGAFYGYFFKAIGLALAGLLVGLICLAVLTPLLRGHAVASVWITLAVTYISAGAPLAFYYSTRVTNYVLSRTSVTGVASLSSSMRLSEVVGMELVNLLAIVGTLGLAIPWAAVRRARYRWSHVAVSFVGPIERVTAAMAAEPGTLGDVAADQLDIDISF